jgi:hypothetical protein
MLYSTASNGTVISEYWTGKDVEGRGYGIESENLNIEPKYK